MPGGRHPVALRSARCHSSSRMRGTAKRCCSLSGAPESAASGESDGRTTSGRVTLTMGIGWLIGSTSAIGACCTVATDSRMTASSPTILSSSASERSMRARPARCATSSRVRSAMRASLWAGGGAAFRRSDAGRCAGWKDVPVLTDTATIQAVLDVLGVFVFALSGAVVAVRRGLDLFGVLVLAWVAGVGGGIIRDLFLGITPPVAVSDWQLLAAAVAAAVLVFLLHGRWEELAAAAPDVRWRRLPYAVRLLDAGGLAIFAVNGALVALDRKSTRLNSSHSQISYAVFCLK